MSFKYFKVLLSFLLIIFILGLSVNNHASAEDHSNYKISNNIESGFGFYTTASDTLPFSPDSVYSRISRTTEDLIAGMELPEKLSTQEWVSDIDELAHAMKKKIPYSKAALGESHLRSVLDSLKQELPGQTRDQRIMSLYRLMNMPAKGTGHMRIFDTQRVFGWRAIPLQMYKFDDGVFIMSAANEELIGQEVLKIANEPIDRVYKKLSPYVTADNRWSRVTHVQERLLEWANPLKALNITDSIYDVPLEIRSQDGDIRSVTVETMRPDTPEYVKYITSPTAIPDTPQELQWSPATTQQDNKDPFYRTEYNKDTDMLYLQFNNVVDETRVPRFSDQSIGDLADSLRTIVNENPIEKFVVDIRTNDGGITDDGNPLVEFLASHPKVNQRGVLYTLISPIAHSAAGLFAHKLEQRTKTLFVGQPSGFSPNIWGEISPHLLPNSKIVTYMSYAYYQGGMPNSSRTYIQPDIHVPFTSGQHFNNVDSTMIVVKEHQAKPYRKIELQKQQKEELLGTYRMTPTHRATIESRDGILFLHMTRGETESFIESELYPQTDWRFATDISDVFLRRKPGSSSLELDWKGKEYTLEQVSTSFTLPLEHIRAGNFEKGAAGLRKTIDAGVKIGNDFTEYPLTDLTEENPLPAWPKTLSEKEKARLALPYTKLSTELMYPSWRTHADLGMIYKILGMDDKLKETAETILYLDRRQASFIEEYLGLEVEDNMLVD